MAKFSYYFILLPLSYLPLGILYIFTDLLYLLLISFFPYRRKVVRRNLHHSFPTISKQERRKIERQFYKHFTDIVAEGIKNLTISQKALQKRMVCSNPEIMYKLYDQGKNVILVSGHFNNWEWLITAQSFLFKHKAVGIGMPLTSSFWDKKLNERRSRFGMKVVHAKNFKKELDSLSQEKIGLLVLADQSPADSHKSYWMQFLHQPTAVLFGTEQIAHELDYAVVFFEVRKEKRGYYSIHLETITEDPKTMNWGEITEAHTHKLEKLIGKNPASWIWSHKRWKRHIPEDLDQLRKIQYEKFQARFKS
jgi:Kdo2-lipid IVA lauroyltransferase/acyltransferase